MSHEGLPRRRTRFSDRIGLLAWNTLLTFFNLIGAAVATVLEPVNLSNDELLVLICLAQAGDALSMGAIERSTLLQAGRLRRAVDKLEARRLVAWGRSPADRRKILVRMTGAGRRLTESLSPVMFDLIRKVVEPLGQQSTEFMREKMRKMLSGTPAHVNDVFTDHRYGGPLPVAPQAASQPGPRSTQRPPTWGLAGWLRCCQWSAYVDRLWRRGFRNSGLRPSQLQVLTSLSGAVEGMTMDTIASATGLRQERVKSTLSALQQAGLIVRSLDVAQPGASPVKLTADGEQKVLEALPMANRAADDLYQGVCDEDLERLLSLIPKACGGAWRVRQHFSVTQSLTGTTSA